MIFTKTELWIATMTTVMLLALLTALAIGCTDKKITPEQQAKIEAENRQFHNNLIKFKAEKIKEIKGAGAK
jgi:ABC-type transporter MlaC component